jgi:Ca2+/Na+ antiporter
LIAKTYLQASGKTRVLFGIIEMYRFGYQYYVTIGGLLALILAIIGASRNADKNKKIISILLSVFAIGFVFIRIWRLAV